MRLSSLIADLDIAAPASGVDAIDVTGLSADSRLVGPGTLFAALAGTKADGSRFVADAAAEGRRRRARGRAGRCSCRAHCTGAADEGAETRALAIGRAVLWQPARNGRRRYGHERQDIGCGILAPALRRGRTQGRISRHHRRREAGWRRLRLAHHARSGHAPRYAGITRQRRHHAPGLRSLVARPRSVPPRRRVASPPPPSPISAATTSTTTRRRKPISQPRCACSRSCCRTARPSSSISMRRARSMLPTWPRRRGLRIVSVGAAGETVRLANLARDGFAQRLTLLHDGNTYDVRLPLIGTYQVANALRRGRPRAGCWRRSRRRHSRARRVSPASKAASKSSARGTARSPLSTTPTSPKRLKRPSTACALS